jgi:bacillithiol system protein YtxJ
MFFTKRTRLLQEKYMKELLNQEDLDACLQASIDTPVFILKHSTACPTSHGAYQRVLEWLEAHDADAPPFYIIKVIQARPVSNALAECLAVQHQSPQLILVDKGKAVSDTSHHMITGEYIEQAMADFS